MAGSEGAASGTEDCLLNVTKEGPVLNMMSKRLRALKKKFNKILQIEESKLQGKVINREQEEVLKTKVAVAALIDEYEKLRQPLQVAVKEELAEREKELTAATLYRDDGGAEETTVAEEKEAEVSLQKGTDEVRKEPEMQDSAVCNSDTGETMNGGARNAHDASRGFHEQFVSSSVVDGNIVDLLTFLYFAQLFDVRSHGEASSSVLWTKTHERSSCLSYDCVTEDETSPLLETDLDDLAYFGSLLTARPPNATLSHRDALQHCIAHAKLWLQNAEAPISKDLGLTYTNLRERLNRILSSEYFTMIPELQTVTEQIAVAAASATAQYASHLLVHKAGDAAGSDEPTVFTPQWRGPFFKNMAEPRDIRSSLRSHSGSSLGQKQTQVEEKQTEEEKQTQVEEKQTEEEKQTQTEEEKQVEEKQKKKQKEGMENLLAYFKNKCSLDTESCQVAAKTVLDAPNRYMALQDLAAFLMLLHSDTKSVELFKMAKGALDIPLGDRQPSSSSGSATYNFSVPSQALDLIEFHTSLGRSHSSQGSLSSLVSGGSSSYHPSTFQDWAKVAWESHVDDDSFPAPASEKVTDCLWPKGQWNAVLERRTRMKKGKEVIMSVEAKFNELIDQQKRRTTPRYVQFVFVKATGNLCGGKRPDFYLTMVGTQTPTHEAVGAILWTQSTSQDARYDSPAAVGEAIAVGQKFLINSSMQRIFVMVGVTNLKEVSWFKVCRSASTFRYMRSPTTAHVASNLAGYMCASPGKLGLNLSSVVKVGKKSFPLGRFLGEGNTSMVHVVTVNNEDFAVKVPKKGHDLSSDIFYLKKLCDIKGIPVINVDYSNPMAMFTQPLCSRFTLEDVFKKNLEPQLAELVDTLKFAHGRMVVNRDVRVENFVLGTNQFFIVDWGYAALLNESVEYAGTTYFASARVLKILEEGKEERFATEASDDLVSLVQSLFLLAKHNQAWKYKLYGLPKTDYAGIRRFWEGFFRASSSDLLTHALNTNYSELQKSIKSWALSL